MAKLISNAGGAPTVVASMREVPLADNHEALEFVQELISGKIDAAVFLTGVGAQVVLRVAESANQRDAYLDAFEENSGGCARSKTGERAAPTWRANRADCAGTKHMA